MEKVLKIAQYIYDEYNNAYNDPIDQMKLHKLLYLTQRESLIENSEPLFEEMFEAWKYGPVCRKVRNAFTNEKFEKAHSEVILSEDIKNMINKIITKYGEKTSWSLSKLTHSEKSWLESRKGLKENENGDNPMLLENIREDADRVRRRRDLLNDKKNIPVFSNCVISISDEQEDEINNSEPVFDYRKKMKELEKRLRRQGVEITTNGCCK